MNLSKLVLKKLEGKEEDCAICGGKIKGMFIWHNSSKIHSSVNDCKNKITHALSEIDDEFVSREEVEKRHLKIINNIIAGYNDKLKTRENIIDQKDKVIDELKDKLVEKEK